MLSGLEKKKKLDEFIKTQNKLALKEKSEIVLGTLKDFKITGRENFLLTGILGIDLNTNGFKKGTYNIIYGSESGGKSTLCLQICEGLQLLNPDTQILYVDAEQTLDESFIARIPNLKKENITFLKEPIMEKAFDMIGEIAKEELVDVIIIDSTDSMTTMAELGKSLEDNLMMDKARILSRALAKLNGDMAKFGITVIIIQQERIEMSGFIAKSHGRSGGKAMKYYPATVTRLSKINSQNEVGKDELTGEAKITTQYVKITNEKSKISEPFKETTTFINLDRKKKLAVEKIKEVVHYATLYGLIQKSGSWYQITLGDGSLQKVQGDAGVTKLLSENVDIYTDLKFLIYSKVLPAELFIVQFDNIRKMLEEENRFIKKNKKDKAKATDREDLLNEMDKTDFHFDETFKVQDYLSDEDYKLAMFNLSNDNDDDLEEENKEEELKEENKIFE